MVEEGIVCTLVSFYTFVWIASVDTRGGRILVLQSIVRMCSNILGGSCIGGESARNRSLCTSFVLVWTCDANWG